MKKRGFVLAVLERVVADAPNHDWRGNKLNWVKC